MQNFSVNVEDISKLPYSEIKQLPTSILIDILRKYHVNTSLVLEKIELVKKLCGKLGIEADVDVSETENSPDQEMKLSYLEDIIQVDEDDLQSNLNTGAKVWCGAKIMAQFLINGSTGSSGHQLPEKVNFCGKTVVELGCGAGLAGLVASFLGAKRVILTDLEDSLCLAERNVRKHSDQLTLKGLAPPVVLPLEWGNLAHLDSLPPNIDFVLAADVIFKAELFYPLRQSMAHICRKNNATCIVAYKRRHSSEEWFFSELQQSGFIIEEIPFENNERVQIFLFSLQQTMHKSKQQISDNLPSKAQNTIISF